MKIKGQKITPPEPILVPIPRVEGDIFFRCAPVLDFEPFQAICPMPKPPVIMRPGKPNLTDPDDKAYNKKLDTYATRKTEWMILQSLMATEDMEWETVNMSDPDTWSNYEKELAESFTPREIDLIVQGAFDVNLPNESHQDEALKRFTASQAEQAEVLTSQKDEPDSTPSGELASD